MTTFSQTVTLDFGVLGEQDVQVDYTYSRGRPGKMYMPNCDPGYPDEPAKVEILNVYLHGFDTQPHLTEAALDSLLDTISNNHSYED